MTINKLTRTLMMIAALASVVFAVQLRAEERQIAVIDWPRAVLFTEKAKVKLEELQGQSDFQESSKQFEALRKEYLESGKKLEKDRALMSAQKREEESKRFFDKQKDLQYLEGKLQQASQEMFEKVVKEYGAEAEEVLKSVMKEKNIGLLLRRGSPAVISADSSYDITDLFVERFNEAK